jgi:hypothetical protein
MGLSKAADRDELRRRFAADDDDVRTEANDAARDVRVALVVEEGPNSTHVEDVVKTALGRDRIPASTLGMLLGAVQNLHARDVAWSLMSRDTAVQHFELWRQVMAAADDDLMAPAGTLCAFAAWLSGNGALAALALGRVAEVCPDYSFLGLIAEILAGGINPDLWEDYRSSLLAMSGVTPLRAGAGAAADDAAG